MNVNKKKKNVRIFLYLYSRYVILFVIILIHLFVLLTPDKFHFPETISEKSLSINRNQKVGFISHITDLHFTPAKEKYNEYVKQMIRNMFDIIKPNVAVISGDINDGRIKKIKISNYKQYEVSWKDFLEVYEEYKNYSIIFCAGNHDEINVEGINHSSHHYLKYIHSYNVDSFLINNRVIDFPSGKVSFISFNPYHYPSPPTPYNVFADIDDHMFNKLKKASMKSDSVLFNVIVSHNPTMAIKNRRRFESFIGDKDNNIRYYMSGHVHFKHGYYQRIGSAVEVVGTSPRRRGTHVTVISIDNGLSVARPVNLAEKYPHIITIPPPYTQFSPLNHYIPNKFRVRVAIFNKDRNISLDCYINGTKRGGFVYDTESDGAIIYGCDVFLEDGLYILELKGDVSDSCLFVVGKKVHPHTVKGYVDYRRIHRLLVIATTVYMNIFILFVLSRFTDSFRDKLEPIQNYMFGGTEDVSFLSQAFMGPIYSLYNISKTLHIIHFKFIIQLSLIFICPLYIRYGDDSIMFCFLWGYICKRGLIIDPSYLLQFSYFPLINLTPYLYLCGLYSVKQGSEYIFKYEKAFLMLTIIVSSIAVIIFSIVGGGIKSVLTSPSLLYIYIFFFSNIKALRKYISLGIPGGKEKEE